MIEDVTCLVEWQIHEVHERARQLGQRRPQQRDGPDDEARPKRRSSQRGRRYLHANRPDRAA